MFHTKQPHSCFHVNSAHLILRYIYSNSGSFPIRIKLVSSNYELALLRIKFECVSKACNSAGDRFHLHPKRHTHDWMVQERSRGGWSEKKSWQIHKAVWLHHGHVAAFTNTLWSNLTSPLSSLPLFLILLSFPPE